MRILLSFLILAVSVAAQNPPALDPAKVFDYDAGKPLDVNMGKTEEVEMMQVNEISYDSPTIGRVPGYLVVPPGKGPFGGILYMHWGQGNKGEWLAEGVEMANRGAVCLMIDDPRLRRSVLFRVPRVILADAAPKNLGDGENTDDFRGKVNRVLSRLGSSPAQTISSEKAAFLVKSGMWLDYGVALCQPDVFDKALAARTEELTNVKIRSCLTMKPRAVGRSRRKTLFLFQLALCGLRPEEARCRPLQLHTG